MSLSDTCVRNCHTTSGYCILYGAFHDIFAGNPFYILATLKTRTGILAIECTLKDAIILV